MTEKKVTNELVAQWLCDSLSPTPRPLDPPARLSLPLPPEAGNPLASPKGQKSGGLLKECQGHSGHQASSPPLSTSS